MATVTPGGTVGPSRGQLDQQKMAEFAKSMQTMGQSMRAYGQLREEKRQFDAGQQFDFLEMQANKAQFGPVQFAVENEELYKGTLRTIFGRSKNRDKLVDGIYKGLSTGAYAFEDVTAMAESLAAQQKASAEEEVARILGESDVPSQAVSAKEGVMERRERFDPKPPAGGVYPGEEGSAGTEEHVVHDYDPEVVAGETTTGKKEGEKRKPIGSIPSMLGRIGKYGEQVEEPPPDGTVIPSMLDRYGKSFASDFEGKSKIEVPILG